MKSIRISFVLVALVLMIVLSACSQADEPTAAPTEAPAEAPAEEPAESAPEEAATEAPAVEEGAGELKRLVVAVTSVPKGEGDRFATNEWALYRYSLGRLIIVDENGAFQPWLALSWEAIEPTIWQFKLRPDVSWWNGDPFTAEDVKYSFDWVLNPDNNHPQRTRIAEITEVEIVDDLTVNVHTEQPSGSLISNIPGSFEVLPAKYHQEVGAAAFDANPVGVGPYKVQVLVPGETLTLVPNELFWGDPPNFDEVVFRAITEESTRLAALEAGEIDVVFNVSPENAPRIESSGFITVIAPENRVMTMTMACEREFGEPLCDARVRRAIALAIDTQGISEALYLGIFPPAKGHTASPTMFGFNPDLEPYPYDPEQAQALLNEAGYGDGFILRLEYPEGRWTKVTELAETVAAQLQAIGITVELIPEDSGTWLANYVNGTTVEMTFTTLGPAFDLDFNTVRFICGNPAIFYCDPEFDAAFNKQKSIGDQAEREQALHELAAIFNEQVPALPLLDWQAIWAFAPELTNISINPDASLNIHIIDQN
jgi:peptide/nickel transport system substrate-binding protein